MASKLFKKTSSGTSPIKFYKKTSAGQVQCPVYRKTANGMERLDQELTEKTYTVSGYADWTHCYIGDSSSDTSLYAKSTDPTLPRQGKYSSYYYYSPMSFKTVLAKVKGKNIKSIKIKMKCEHAYYSGGLSTYISGTNITNSSAPNNITTSVFNNKKYSSDVSFSVDGTKTITLNSTAIADVKAGNITGFRPVASAGWSLTDYGYFSASGNSRPHIEITYVEEVGE